MNCHGELSARCESGGFYRASAVRGVIDEAARMLQRAGIDSARLDAELLMAAAADAPRARLIAGLVAPAEPAMRRYARWVARRAAREPLAYILGHREFYSLDFEVTPAVLIPRPETETLVRVALECLGERPDARVLDIGTGSGAIAVAIASHARSATVVATDISQAALEVARRNATRHGVLARLEFIRADLWPPEQPLFDLIVSNPPYVAAGAIDLLAPEIARFEPRIALAAGPDGLSFYRRIAHDAREYLQSGGCLLLEVGDGQAGAVASLCTLAGASGVTTINDLAATQRVVIVRFDSVR